MTDPTENLVQRRLVVVLLNNLGQRARLPLEIGARRIYHEVDGIAHAFVSRFRCVQYVVSGPVERARDLFIVVGLRHGSSWHEVAVA